MTAPHIGNTGVNDEDAESAPDLGGRLRRARPRPPALQLALRAHPGRRAGRAGRRRHQRHRHPRADPAPARARRDARRHLLRRRDRADATRHAARPRCWPARRWPAPTWPARSPPTRRTSVRPAVGEHAVHRRRRRPRHQGHDPAPAGRARHRACTSCPPTRHRSTTSRPSTPGRRLLLQRPRRPGHRRPPGRAACAPCWSARSRSSASASATRSWAAPSASAPTSSATATAASTSPCRTAHRQGRDHRAQPRLRRRRPARPGHATTTTLRPGRGQPRLPQRRRRRGPAAASTCRPSRVQYHPEAAAGPHDAAYLFDRFVD